MCLVLYFALAIGVPELPTSTPHCWLCYYFGAIKTRYGKDAAATSQRHLVMAEAELHRSGDKRLFECCVEYHSLYDIARFCWFEDMDEEVSEECFWA